MTRFWLVRHGPTHARTMVGWSDLPADLSDAPALARLNAALPAEALLISSDLSRAVTTADALSQPGRRRLPHDRALREIHFGAWELRSYAECEAGDPLLARRFWEEPGSLSAPGGESWDLMAGRVSKALARLQGQHSEVIIVAHFGAILAAVQHALQIPAKEVLSHRIGNLSLTCLELGDSATPGRLHRINHSP
ncbi:histidine phosphatase family protein [Pseudogemmobacter faecipullorum]|uniref:Histidine phosphatase family protein n=1 Tax=Pseudogemmobacter faecipullorum TaxID=2755041 RepID=A0ABS8CI12_9RHOB|nr:histidine phosphatase family protein [Pseudogemmobacter faecipullorum]MCB5409029.1 histidine phosphatase family protein [Pseudogemmobacter faecipullorum]